MFIKTTDFDPGVGVYNLSDGGTFILKLDPSGNFVWAKKIGTNKNTVGHDIALDASDNIYITGNYEQTSDFDPGTGTYNLTSTRYDDIFIVKLNNSGDFVWARSMGGTSYDNGRSIVVDRDANVYTTGYFHEIVDFNPGSGTANLTSKGGPDIFISKLDASGNFIWAKRLGGTSSDEAFSIALDISNNIYTTGNFGGTIDFDPGTNVSNLTSVGDNDIFISKLDANGKFIWAKNIGKKPLSMTARCLITDKSGSVYTTGEFGGSTDFDPGPGIFNLCCGGIFISKLDPSGNFVWAMQIGDTVAGTGNSITLDESGNIYTTGLIDYFLWEDGLFNLKEAGKFFISKVSQATNGIYENKTKFIVNIYPNPAINILNVKLGSLNNEEYKIQMLNSIGQIVLDETSFNQHAQLNIHHLPAGLYFVKVISDNNLIATQKIIKR